MGEFSKQVIRDLMQQKAERNLRLELLAQQRKNELEQMRLKEQQAIAAEGRSKAPLGGFQATNDPIQDLFLQRGSQEQQPSLYSTYMSGKNTETRSRSKAKELKGKEFDALKASYDSLQTLKALVNKYESDPEKVEGPIGPLDPRSGAFGSFIGNISSQLAASPEFNDFKRDAKQYFDQYRLAITKSQASFKEINFLKPSTLNLEETPENFKVSLYKELGKVAENQRRMESFLTKKGLDTSEYSDPEAQELSNQFKHLWSGDKGKKILGPGNLSGNRGPVRGSKEDLMQRMEAMEQRRARELGQ